MHWESLIYPMCVEPPCRGILLIGFGLRPQASKQLHAHPPSLLLRAQGCLHRLRAASIAYHLVCTGASPDPHIPTGSPHTLVAVAAIVVATVSMLAAVAPTVLGVIPVIDPGGVDYTCGGLGEVLVEEYWGTGWKIIHNKMV